MGAVEHLTISFPAAVADEMRGWVATGEFTDLDALMLAAVHAFGVGGPSPHDVDKATEAKICAAYDRWRANPEDVIPLDEAMAQLRSTGRGGR